MKWYQNLKELLKDPNFNRFEHLNSFELPADLLITPNCVKDVNFIYIGMYKFNDLFLPMAIKFIEQENNRRLKANLQPLTIVFQCSFCSPLDPHIPFWGYYFRRISSHFKLDPGILVSRTPELPTLGTRYVYKPYSRVKNTHFYVATEDDITFCRQMRKWQEDLIIPPNFK